MNIVRISNLSGESGGSNVMGSLGRQFWQRDGKAELVAREMVARSLLGINVDVQDPIDISRQHSMEVRFPICALLPNIKGARCRGLVPINALFDHVVHEIPVMIPLCLGAVVAENEYFWVVAHPVVVVGVKHDPNAIKVISHPEKRPRQPTPIVFFRIGRVHRIVQNPERKPISANMV